ncbi:hypothetical protein TTRE_0000509601 [Trichuris trichiura]|uniref:Uncharacterized protein n=1 Tax=Trichuris trichiura TaxID=36087 RepID=A0A077ZAH9_TRITR|nr:hypothetical protein TTRE_0000509601 [Trichuris trichiura]
MTRTHFQVGPAIIERRADQAVGSLVPTFPTAASGTTSISSSSHAPIDRAHKALNRPLFSRRRRGKFSTSPIDSRLCASSILGWSVGKLESSVHLVPATRSRSLPRKDSRGEEAESIFLIPDCMQAMAA